jgi:hypothetical protein
VYRCTAAGLRSAGQADDLEVILEVVEELTADEPGSARDDETR